MRTKVQKWGNSLAIRIPKSFAIEMDMDQDSPVDVSLADGKLIVSPARKMKVTLQQLLEQVTEENMHSEVDTGETVGKEVW